MVTRVLAFAGLVLLGTLGFTASAMAACSTTGTITFASGCPGTYGPSATASASGSKLTVDSVTVDDPDDGANSFSRIVLKAGSETNAAIDIELAVTGTTSVDSHNSAAVYALTAKGDITITIGEDVHLDAQQAGVFAKADSTLSTRGGDVTVTNYGAIEAGEILNGSLGSEAIRVRALQGAGTIYNYGDVTSTVGRGLRIDGSSITGSDLDDLVVNDAKVNAYLDGIHINATTGAATIENGEDGDVVSESQRGAVASSKNNAATLKNDGKITGFAAGALVWGGKDATATNTGTITAGTADLNDANDYLNFGVQIWSTNEGTAKLVNTEDGQIIAHDGLAAWMMSTDGDVVIENDGVLLGKSTAIYVGADKLAEQWEENPQDVPDYEGAVGGDLSLTNSGTITADNTADFTDGMALITLNGVDLGDVSLTNLAGGFIGAGHVEGTDFSLEALRALTPAELDGLDAAATNATIAMAIDAEAATIINEGTLVGRVAVESPFDTFGSGPVSATAVEFSNSGLWVTSGESGFAGSLPGTLSNSGDVFTLGSTAFTGAIDNSGTLWVNATADHAADLTIAGDYSGSGDARMAFNVGAGASTSEGAMVKVTGTVSGQTRIDLVGLEAWDWKSGVTLDLIDADSGTPALGADSFVLNAPPVLGLIQYNLEYDAADLLWSFSTEVSQQSVDGITEAANAVSTSVLDIASNLQFHTDELRDAFWSGGETEPMGYAAFAPASPAEDAISDATAAPADRLPTLRTWISAQGAAGMAGDYSGRQGTFTVGADISADVSDTLIVGGVFGTLTSTGLAADVSGNTTSIRSQAIGAYGTVMWNSGLFASGTVAAETAAIDIALSGADAAFGADLYGGRVDVGYRTQIGDLHVEPSVGVTYGQTQYDDFEMSNTIVSLGEADTLGGEARLRISQTYVADNGVVEPFVILSLGNRSTDGEVSMSGLGSIEALDDGGVYGGVSTGLQFKGLDGKLSGFLRADGTVSDGSYWGAVKAGGAYSF